MAQSILSGTGAAIAWATALLFLRRSRMSVFLHGLIAGGLCITVAAVLRFTNMQHISWYIYLAVFLMITLAITIEEGAEHGNAIMAFCVAAGAFCVFRIAEGLDWWRIPVQIVLQLGFFLFAYKMRNSFPEKGWREYFSSLWPHDKKLNVRLGHVYTVLIAQCLLCCACALLMKPGGTACVVMVVVMTCVFWGALLLASIFIEYRRETMAALIEQQYRSEMQNFMNVIRSQRHDYNFHVQTLARLLHTRNVEACEKYVDELVKDSIAANTLLPIKDPAISALINNFRTLAAREGVELHIDVQNDLSCVVTNVYETNKIISNLLQNAIDETRTHADKSYGIHLTILKRGEFCVIHVANAFHETILPGQYITDIYRHGYTTKPGHDGVGLSSVRTLLERYKGVIYTQVDGDVIRFTAKIPLRYTANKEDEMQREDNA